MLEAPGPPNWQKAWLKALHSAHLNRFGDGKGVGPWRMVFRAIRQGDLLSVLLLAFCLDPLLTMSQANRPPSN